MTQLPHNTLCCVACYASAQFTQISLIFSCGEEGCDGDHRAVCASCVLAEELRASSESAPCTVLWSLSTAPSQLRNVALALPCALPAESTVTKPPAYRLGDDVVTSPAAFMDAVNWKLHSAKQTKCVFVLCVWCRVAASARTLPVFFFTLDVFFFFFFFFFLVFVKFLARNKKRGFKRRKWQKTG